MHQECYHYNYMHQRFEVSRHQNIMTSDIHASNKLNITSEKKITTSSIFPIYSRKCQKIVTLYASLHHSSSLFEIVKSEQSSQYSNHHENHNQIIIIATINYNFSIHNDNYHNHKQYNNGRCLSIQQYKQCH